MTAPYLRGACPRAVRETRRRVFGQLAVDKNAERRMAKGWTKFPHRRQEIRLHADHVKKILGPTAQGRCRSRSPRATPSSTPGLPFMRATFKRPHRARHEAAGTDGINVANKSQAIYANYLESEREAEARTVRGSRGARRTSCSGINPRMPMRTTGRRTRSAATRRASRSLRHWHKGSAARSRQRSKRPSSWLRSMPTRTSPWAPITLR